jgi:hypothetical protein
MSRDQQIGRARNPRAVIIATLPLALLGALLPAGSAGCGQNRPPAGSPTAAQMKAAAPPPAGVPGHQPSYAETREAQKERGGGGGSSQ